MIRYLLRAGGIALAIVVPVLALQLNMTQQLLNQQEHISAQRFQKTALVLIEHAHHANDDLAIQGILQSLGETAGVLFACVVNEQERILAHTQPSRLGQTLKVSSRIPGTWSEVLRENHQPWGRFIFRLSQANKMAARLKIKIAAILAAALLVGAFLLAAVPSRMRILRVERENAEWKALVEEESKKSQRAQADQRAVTHQWSVWLLKALEQVPQPVLLLDARQRVAGLNTLAASAIGVSDPSRLVGQSWQEISCFRDCGKILERTLAFPSQPIEWSGKNGTPRLRFETDAQGMAGTWITFI